MTRALKWLLPMLGVAQRILLHTGVLDARTTIWLVLLIAVALRHRHDPHP